ncbi:MAG: hypothetical protein WC755_08715 [Candidatus Woesearchaeota archaeon]|jgi:hypothetical protein
MKPIKINSISQSIKIRTRNNLEIIEKLIEEYLEKFDTSEKLNFKK